MALAITPKQRETEILSGDWLNISGVRFDKLGIKVISIAIKTRKPEWILESEIRRRSIGVNAKFIVNLQK